MEVQGSIALVGILDLIQVAGFHARDFVLSLDNAAGEGAITLQGGVVRDARLAGKSGPDALFALLTAATEGDFRITPLPETPVEETVSLKTEQILMRIAMAMPPPDQQTPCDPSWYVGGHTGLLSVPEMLQIFENNKRSVVLSVDPGGERETTITISEGGILDATGDDIRGAEAVYRCFGMHQARFAITCPEEPPAVTEMLDIASVVCEGLRRLDEARLVREETGRDNEAAQRMLQALAEGQLDEPVRIQIAKRYLPEGEVAPATVIMKLAVDDSPAVREAALSTVMDLPEPVLATFAGDSETPPSLLRFLMLEVGAESVAAEAIRNRMTPADALVLYAPRAKGEALDAYRERRALLEELRTLRNALRHNKRCDFLDVLDELDKRPVESKMRRTTFDAPPPDPSGTEPPVVLEKPKKDPRKKKAAAGKMGPKDIQYIVKRGSQRQKLRLVSGNDADVAVEIVSQPGTGESFIESVAESTASNGAALAWIAQAPQFRRKPSISRVLLFNPKTPVHATIPLVRQAREDDLNRIATSRDLPDGLRAAARNQLEKKKQKK